MIVLFTGTVHTINLHRKYKTQHYPTNTESRNSGIQAWLIRVIFLTSCTFVNFLWTDCFLFSVKNYSYHNINKTLTSNTIHITNMIKTLTSNTIHITNMNKTLTSNTIHITNMNKTLTSKPIYITNISKTLTSKTYAYSRNLWTSYLLKYFHHAFKSKSIIILGLDFLINDLHSVSIQNSLTCIV